MNSQENGLIDTLRTLKDNGSPPNYPEGHGQESYGINSIVTDGYTDKGLTLTMNSL